MIVPTSSDFFPLPGGLGLVRSKMGPCRCPGSNVCGAPTAWRHEGQTCNNARFYLTRYHEVWTDPETGEQRRRTENRVICPRCLQPKRGEVPTHTIDMNTGEIKPHVPG